jgi:hypothetical protein
MNFTQNDKIEQIKNETLVVRVDMGKETNFARALKKLIKFTNSREGFSAFDKWVSEVSLANAKMDVIVGFEPTRHYYTHTSACNNLSISGIEALIFICRHQPTDLCGKTTTGTIACR